jgi:dUTPase
LLYEGAEMPFMTITGVDITSHDASAGFAIYFSPCPPSDELPAVWLDLHVADEYYQDCEDDTRRKFLTDAATGSRYIRLRPHKGIRLVTTEHIGLDCNHTAVVVNVAGKAKHGLIVAPGKIDPGFHPRQLVLVVYNQSDRTILLRGGDKIACVAFARLSTTSKATTSRGHANGTLPDFEVPRWRRVANWLANRDYTGLAYDVLKIAIGAAIALFGAWLASRFKWK